ncbi:hypothetical protein [Mycetocola zhujimingii]|uniref:hypothetical protein n=1 Tax=Mycetocola zhujimingii TaxID=2079792 RepID=UPI0011B1E5B1|nr:hypothetical protein [Mycetocola zhujimingii]
MSNYEVPPEHELDTLTELRGIERGLWEVKTLNSVHLFDLDNQTVTRVPGPNSRPGINDVPREIRSIEKCVVGRSGYWTMYPERYREEVDFYWQWSTPIASITLLRETARTDE